ncbi:hypothetical protein McpSp1_14660 [Methanocorpusculaceae archaeon Sp1]|uniref:Uncharacterized protein n=1 Tax=Methanorbis furvi TaxID=3028299 RepID=A0AAE4MC91_9EURY|nr:hypothetical protein [Methanocorpusculaceae archaeon Sp1]MDV0441450.1 hypothetical protein [Methanocorpusculaceae archaeon Ag1]
MKGNDLEQWMPMIWLFVGIIILVVIGVGAIYMAGDVPETIAIKYADPANWHSLGSDPEAELDVFYLYDDVNVSDISPYETNVDVSLYEIHNRVSDELTATVDAYPSGMNNYIPYYRQVTQYAQEADLPIIEDAARMIAYADAKAAFHYYMNVRNEGRPYILAGSGQGAEYIAEMISEWFGTRPAYLKNLQGVYLDGKLQSNDTITELLGDKTILVL